MSVRKQFFSAWKKHYNILSVPFYTIIMIVVEEIMETEFKCPQQARLKLYYVMSYFLLPVSIIFFLSLIFQPSCIPWARCMKKYSVSQKAEIICRALLPPLLWCVILLLDGRYIDCVISINEGNRTQKTTQNTATESPTVAYMLSQVSGLLVLTVLVIAYGLYTVYPFWFCCNDEEGHGREQMELLLEEKTEEYIKESTTENAQQIIKQHLEPTIKPLLIEYLGKTDFKKLWENTGKSMKYLAEKWWNDEGQELTAVSSPT